MHVLSNIHRSIAYTHDTASARNNPHGSVRLRRYHEPGRLLSAKKQQLELQIHTSPPAWTLRVAIFALYSGTAVKRGCNRPMNQPHGTVGRSNASKAFERARLESAQCRQGARAPRGDQRLGTNPQSGHG